MSDPTTPPGKITINVPAEHAAKAAEQLQAAAGTGDTVSVELDTETAQALLGAMHSSLADAGAMLLVVTAEPEVA